MFRKIICFLVIFLSIQTLVAQKINLSGEWNFAIDKEDVGVGEKWWQEELSETILLPGSMATNDKGFAVNINTKFVGGINDKSFYEKPEYAKYRTDENFKIPFWLQSKKYYQGAAWYQRKVTIPKSWKKQNIELLLERCHWETRVWIDDDEIGMRNSLGTPHQYDLSSELSPGEHTITICVDNRVKEIDPGENSHSISDHTQTNWNGIVGEISLRKRAAISIKNLQLYPDIKAHKVFVKLIIFNQSRTQKASLKLQVEGINQAPFVKDGILVSKGLDTLSFEYPMGKELKLWSEFHPHLYTMNVELSTKRSNDSYSTNFGMREIKVVGKQLRINDKPLFLRNIGMCHFS